MGNHQDVSRQQGKTQASASNRLGKLALQGHHVNIDSCPEHVTVTITRKEGYAHHIHIGIEGLPEHARSSPAFARYPQSVLVSYALHAVADWSAEVDQRATAPCLGCTTLHGTAANFNAQTGGYDWYCPACFYGAYEETA